ncbi:hypothetical protein X733_33195 [Mesorhizobium sp. L2C067A000]|nr:hypothetical protein X733_33195 [Mesorhizobium sp. L2C067A000]
MLRSNTQQCTITARAGLARQGGKRLAARVTFFAYAVGMSKMSKQNKNDVIDAAAIAEQRMRRGRTKP